MTMQPKTQILSVKKLKPNPNNPRIVKDDKFAKLVKSIKDFPQMMELRPIVVDSDMVILGGNMRYKACVDAGMKDVPVVVASDLTDEQKREFIIKDNLGYGEWDWRTLSTDWDVDQLNEWGLDITSDEALQSSENNDSFEVAVHSDVIKGDIFQIGKHRLLCGDSTDSNDVDKLMNGKFADMVFTDPPWNVNYGNVKKGNAQGDKPRKILNDSMSTKDFAEFMKAAFSLMASSSKKGCPTYVVMSAQEWGSLMTALAENNYHWSSTIIWNKSHLVLSRKDYHTKYEPIWYGWLDGAPRLQEVKNRKECDVWDFDRPTKSELHPTTKPVDLVQRAILNSSRQGNIILEMFCGSGTTMVAAENTQRACYAMELDPIYCQTIVKRMKDAFPNIAIKKNGEPYNLQS